MIDKLKLMYRVMVSDFTVGFSGKEDKSISYMVGSTNGVTSILASVVLSQMAGKLRDKHVESLVDNGYAKHVASLTEDWNSWIALGAKNPSTNPAEFIDLGEGRDNDT